MVIISQDLDPIRALMETWFVLVRAGEKLEITKTSSAWTELNKFWCIYTVELLAAIRNSCYRELYNDIESCL